MTQEDIDKIETLLGYLEYFNRAVTYGINPFELPDIIAETKEWITKLKSELNEKH